MGIQKEIWIDAIQEKVFAGNEFITKSVSHDEWIENSKVHIPQAGTIPAVQKDRATVPAVISQRTDTDRDYSLSEYTTDPILLKDVEKLQVNYNKMESIIDQHRRKIADRLGLEFLYMASGSTLKTAGGQIVLTTGTATANIAPPDGTGNRKSVKLKDIAAVAGKFDKDEMSLDGRYLNFPSDVYWDLLREEPTLLSKEYNPRTDADLAMGIVKSIYGINILIRSYTSVYADAATPTLKAVGAATASDDNWACVGWHISAMAKALGDIKVYFNEDDAAMYGSYFSAGVMFAPKALRTDGKGIVCIVQDT